MMNRRKFLHTLEGGLAVTSLAGLALPHVHAAGSDQIQLALVGCGGRGGGAAADAMMQSGPPKLVAMADVFEHKLAGSHNALVNKFTHQVDVPEERRFLGFDSYKQAMDCLKPGDVVILTTPPAFRWVHFKYAIEKGLNVFMEKPICVDAPTGRRMIALGEEAKKKNLKVGVGLMMRHCRGRRALREQIQRGAIGEVHTMRSYRMQGPGGSAFTDPSMRKEGMSELMFQVSRFHSFLWLSGGLFSDFYIHHIDEACWMKDAWPIKCHAVGARHYRGENIDQNFDNYQVEYIYEDGARLFFYGRTMMGMKNESSGFIHGTKGLAVASLGSHHLAKAGRIYAGQNMDRSKETWSFLKGPDEVAPSPYDMEWKDLLDAIRDDQPYNEVERGARASMVTAMGRFAAHTGQEVTWEEYQNNPHEFAPGVDKLTLESDAPLKADEHGKYPVPEPGLKRDREY